MKFPENAVIVLDIAGSKARLAVTLERVRADLEALGFHQDKGQFVRPVADDGDRRQLAHALVRLGAIFSVGPGWAPSELLEYYEKQGEKFGPYKLIAWTGPDSFDIRAH